MQKILFVCLGNICRSPAAEAMFRAECPEVEVDSAGTSDFHVGEPPYGAMQQAARARGIEMSNLRARQFAPKDFTTFDLIVVMDRENRRVVEAQRPQGNGTPVLLFAALAEGWDVTEVPDPYYTRDFNGCLDLLQAAAKGLRRHIGRD